VTLRNSWARRPPFLFSHRARVDQLVCDPRSYVRAHTASGRALWAPMLAWSAGPVGIGVTGDNSLASLTGSNWLLQVCPDGSWVLYREDGADLIVTPWDDPPDHVGATARHPSLAFDQSARVVLAWEEEQVIKVRRWDPTLGQYVENVSFAGVDPVVVLDAVWSRYVPGSDVLLFYLSTDRERLMCRVQRDVYAVEYEIWDFEAPTVLDGVVALPWRYEVLTSDEHGTPMDPLLVSAVYPVRTSVPVAGDGEVIEGLYELLASEYRHGITVSGDAHVDVGEYRLVVTRYAHSITVVGDGVVEGGEYDQVVTPYTHTIRVDGDAAVHSGALIGPAIQVIHSLAVVGDGVIAGGSYVEG